MPIYVSMVTMQGGEKGREGEVMSAPALPLPLGSEAISFSTQVTPSLCAWLPEDGKEHHCLNA